MTDDPTQTPDGPEEGAQPSEQVSLPSQAPQPQAEPFSIDLTHLREQVSGVQRVTDLTSRMAEMVRRACLKDPAREQVDYAVGVTVVPQEDGGIQPCFVVVLGLPSLILGQKANLSVLVPNLWLEETEVQRLVGNGLEELRRARSSLLNQQNGQGQGLGPLGPFGTPG
jgi:hypothetical protein